MSLLLPGPAAHESRTIQTFLTRDEVVRHLEALGLAVSLELPLVIVDIQRGGPSTGLPTKTEQADLLQVMFGRNGESPLPIIAASSPKDCFDIAIDTGSTEWALDLAHINAVDVFPNGDWLIDMRHMNALYRVNPDTGDIVWKLGGSTTTS